MDLPSGDGQFESLDQLFEVRPQLINFGLNMRHPGHLNL
jgi:hypothetical protein